MGGRELNTIAIQGQKLSIVVSLSFSRLARTPATSRQATPEAKAPTQVIEASAQAGLEATKREASVSVV